MQAGRQQGRQRGGVAAVDLAPARGSGLEGVADVVGGLGDPVGFVLDADAVAAEVHGLDDGGADAGHGVEHDVAGVGVGADGVPGDGGQHLAGVGQRLRGVSAAT